MNKVILIHCLFDLGFFETAMVRFGTTIIFFGVTLADRQADDVAALYKS